MKTNQLSNMIYKEPNLGTIFKTNIQEKTFLFKIADGLGIVGDLIGAAMPTGGGVVSTGASVIADVLRKHEYDRFQDRMGSIVENRDINDLCELARLIARELADRYKEQLLQLNPIVEEAPCVDCSCCTNLFCCKKKETIGRIVGK